MDKIVGPCPICGRDMIEGKTIDRHHFTPKSMGGKSMDYIHKVCHTKIHSLFSNKQLATHYDTPEKLLMNIHVQRFVKWIQKKGDSYYSKNKRRKTR